MQILLKSLTFKCTRNTVEFTIELARVPDGDVLAYFSALNRSATTLLNSPNSTLLLSLMNDIRANGLWVVNSTSPTTFKFIYHDKEVLRHRVEGKSPTAAQCFLVKKSSLYVQCLLDLMHVMNHSWIKEKFDLNDPNCTETRLRFNADPLRLELRELQPNFSKTEFLATLPMIAHDITSEIRTILKVRHEAIENVSLSLVETLKIPEKFHSIRATHMAFEEMMLVYLATSPTRDSKYQHYLETLARLRVVVGSVYDANVAALKERAAVDRQRALAFLDSQETPIIVSQDGYPMMDQGWPRDRALDNIERLHTMQTQQSLFSDRPNTPLSFAKKLADHPRPILAADIGAGSGRLLHDLKNALDGHVKCIAVGVTPLDPLFAKIMSAIYYAPLPESDQLLKQFANTLDFLIDTYGASTYATIGMNRNINPIAAIFMYSQLLAPEGICHIIVSGVQKLQDGTPTGFVCTRARLEAIFHAMGYTSFKVQETVIRSQVAGFENTTMTDFLVNFKKPPCEQLVLLPELTYEDLLSELDRGLGTPVVFEHQDGFGKFADFPIKPVTYGGDSSRLTTRNLSEIGLRRCIIESGFGDGPEARFVFYFETVMQATFFLQKFREKYRGRGVEDWKAIFDQRSSTQILVSYNSSAKAREFYLAILGDSEPSEAFIQRKLQRTQENMTYWKQVWTEALGQLQENFDIPGLDLTTIASPEFLIPVQDPPQSLTIECEDACAALRLNGLI